MVDLPGQRHGVGPIGTRLAGMLRRWRHDTTDGGVARRFASLSFLYRLANAGIAFGSQILLARWMGGFEFGVYVYVWTWCLLLSTLATLGFMSSPQRFIPEYRVTGASDLLRGFLFGSRWISFGLATLIAGIGVLGLVLFGEHLESWLIIPAYLAFACLPMLVVIGVQEGIARSYDWSDLALVPTYILRPLLLIGGLWLMHAMGYETGAREAMIVSVVTVWASGLWQLAALDRRLAKHVEKGPRAYATGTWIRVSASIFMVEGFYLLLTYSDILILQHFVSPEQVAIYFAASKLTAIVAFVYFAVASAAAHRYTQYHVSGDRAALQAFVRQSVAWTFLPSLAAAVVILALGEPLLWLFGPEFTAGYPVLPILMIGLLARASIGPAERLLTMLGHQSACGWVYMAAFATNVILNFALVPSLGLSGAAVATAGAVLVESVMLFVLVKKRLGLHAFYWGGRLTAKA